MEIKFLKISFIVLALNAGMALNAQVTIGSAVDPVKGALLELKEQAADTNNITASKGLMYPRVKLSSRTDLFPMFEKAAGSGVANADYNTPAKKAAEDLAHVGLMVYNTGSSEVGEGLCVWTGTNWRKIDDSPSEKAAINGQLTVNDLALSPAFRANYSYGGNNPAYKGYMEVLYTEGNGGSYAGGEVLTGTIPGTSNAVLKAQLMSGKLGVGGGKLIYEVTSDPAVSIRLSAQQNVKFSAINPQTIDLQFSGTQRPNVTVGLDATTSANVHTLLHTAAKDNLISKNRTDSDLSGEPLMTIPADKGHLLNWDKKPVVPERGSYAASIRLYGQRKDDAAGYPTEIIANGAYYVYLVKVKRNASGNWTEGAVVDAAEINPVFPTKNSTATYTVTLGGSFEAGDEMGVVMAKYNMSPNWEIFAWVANRMTSGSGSGVVPERYFSKSQAQPVRTSLIWWKL
ncbi:MAG: hypothetical protein LBG77_05090 [Dysgonamonadaceae bacterium]|jgi:hypothetical protein|nr:hypothetical protein [Dysgonamonadaceae bacterium]